MKTSTIVWILVVIVIVVLGGWYALSMHGSALPVTTSTSTASTTAGTDIGSNLALGTNSTAALGQFLVAYNGMTLYTYAPDTAGVSNCTDSCAVEWPPYTVSNASAGNLVGEAPLSGTINTLTRADGSLQVTYNGHPLYFYAGDKGANDVNGQGLGNVWFVAKP